MKPQLRHLHEEQNPHREDGMANLETGAFSAHHQHHHATGGQGLNEMLKPNPRLWFSTHPAEVIEHVVGLVANRFPLAGDQIALPHFDGGDHLFRELLLNQLFAQIGIGAQVATAPQGAR